jgi:membrane associated rhomboid family serine protease
MWVLFENLTRTQANLCALVLSSAAVPYRLRKNRSGWDVWVDESRYQSAREAMALYFQENRRDGEETASLPEFSPIRSGLSVSVLVSSLIVCVLLAVWYVRVQHGSGETEMIHRFSASAVKILDGEYFRAVTALMLHRDAAHLAGNMAGLLVFGIAAGILAGWGCGWLMVLVSGVAGNLINAFMYESAHVSIGASTAVFGAIGILAGYQGVRLRQATRRLKAAWLPLAGGLALLGMLGSGDVSVDIMAHLFGFFCGILLGAAYGWRFLRPPAEIFQILCAILASGIVAWAWWAG